MIGVIRDVEVLANNDLILTIDAGRQIQVDRGTAQNLSPVEPHAGGLLLAGQDVGGRWILVVGGTDGEFVLNGDGVDQGDKVIVSPERPLTPDPGPTRTLVLLKAERFPTETYVQDGRYRSPTGAFVLGPDGRLIDYVP